MRDAGVEAFGPLFSFNRVRGEARMSLPGFSRPDPKPGNGPMAVQLLPSRAHLLLLTFAHFDDEATRQRVSEVGHQPGGVGAVPAEISAAIHPRINNRT
jgi:hypothetical protein